MSETEPTIHVAGICGISVPCGFTSGSSSEPATPKLPIGLQLQGKALNEGRLFEIAHAYEQSTDWHKARPEI